MSASPTPEQVAAAREWLDYVEKFHADIGNADQHACTIKALLDQPRLIDVCDHKAIDELLERIRPAIYPTNLGRSDFTTILRIMHEPKREVEVTTPLRGSVADSGLQECPKAETLLPCPFCGSHAISGDPREYDRTLQPWVECSNPTCEALIAHNTPEQVAAAWNRRAPLSNPES